MTVKEYFASAFVFDIPFMGLDQTEARRMACEIAFLLNSSSHYKGYYAFSPYTYMDQRKSEAYGGRGFRILAIRHETDIKEITIRKSYDLSIHSKDTSVEAARIQGFIDGAAIAIKERELEQKQ